MKTTFDVRIQGIRVHEGTKRNSYNFRWSVAGRRFGKSFSTKAMAESYRSTLLVAQRQGVAFDVTSGLPESLARKANSQTWLAHAEAFVDMKWPAASPKHRVSIAESLSTITPVFLKSNRGVPSQKEMRAALYGWAFNKVRRDSGAMPEATARILAWIEDNTYHVTDLADSGLVRKALDALALRMDGKPAAATTVARKRGIFYSTLDYAVELKLLESHPLTHIKWTAPKTDEVIDRRTVVNPRQAAELLRAVAARSEDLEVFFACMYYSALRPEEALFLRGCDYKSPRPGEQFGWFELAGATVALGKQWSGTDSLHENRELKHRAKSATRSVPVPPELSALLDRHITKHNIGSMGKLFVVRTGANPGRPISSSTYTRAWRKAREDALTAEQQASPLAKVPYHLRHAAVSLWLNGGVPATQVAEWAGHSLHVLLKVYAKCIDGQEEAALLRILAALKL
jgi:integrase